MAAKVDDGLMMSHCEIAGSEVQTPDVSFVTHQICAEMMAGRLERRLVLKVEVFDHAVAHHLGGRMLFETEVSLVYLL